MAQFDCCPTVNAGRPGHLMVLLFSVGLHCTLFIFGIQSSFSWTAGLGAFAQMMKEVPSQLPILLWLIKASYVFPVLFTCLIAVTFFAISMKNGRLVRVMALLQCALVATHVAFAISTAAFYAEFLRPKLESKEVVIDAAARHPASLYTLESYSRVSKNSNSYNNYMRVYVSSTDWYLRFYCGKLESVLSNTDSESASEDTGKTLFTPDDISSCDDETFGDAMARFVYDVFAMPGCMFSGLFVAILIQHQVLFYVRLSEREGCENWKSCSPLCLTSWCICFTITFRVPIIDEQNEIAESGQQNRTEESRRLHVEQALVSRV